MNKYNKALLLGACLSAAAALLHVIIIVGGAPWYRFFGAGEALATMAERGDYYPTIITLCIAMILMLWSLYAFSGAGLFRPLPFQKVALVVISIIYLLRGVVFIPAYFVEPGIVDAFLLWSSLICLLYALCYIVGTWQVWQKL